MLSEFLLYLVATLATVGGILLLERIVAGPHSTAGTGYARVDSAFDFDRLRRKQYGAGMPRVLRRGRRSSLPLLQQFIGEPRQLREAGEQLIPVASIVGSVDGASQLFDRNFRPVSDRARARLATYWSPCARASHSRPSRCGHGAASTTFSTAIIGSQQPGPWVATTSALMSSKWLSCLATTMGVLTVGVRRRTRTEPSAAPEIAHSVLRRRQDSPCLWPSRRRACSSTHLAACRL
jgi:hypothetical protein